MNRSYGCKVTGPRTEALGSAISGIREKNDLGFQICTQTKAAAQALFTGIDGARRSGKTAARCSRAGPHRIRPAGSRRGGGGGATGRRGARRRRRRGGEAAGWRGGSARRPAGSGRRRRRRARAADRRGRRGPPRAGEGPAWALRAGDAGGGAVKWARRAGEWEAATWWRWRRDFSSGGGRTRPAARR